MKSVNECEMCLEFKQFLIEFITFFLSRKCDKRKIILNFLIKIDFDILFTLNLFETTLNDSNYSSLSSQNDLGLHFSVLKNAKQKREIESVNLISKF